MKDEACNDRIPVSILVEGTGLIDKGLHGNCKHSHLCTYTLKIDAPDHNPDPYFLGSHTHPACRDLQARSAAARRGGWPAKAAAAENLSPKASTFPCFGSLTPEMPVKFKQGSKF